MNQDNHHMIRNIMALALAILAGLLIMTLAGCGYETEKANGLIDDVNATQVSLEPKASDVDKLLSEAIAQSSAGQVDAEKVSLTKAQGLLDEIITSAEQMKSKVDEAAGLNISDSYRSYLTAESRAVDALIKLENLNRQFVTLLLEDPTLEKPDTLQKMTDLQKAADEQTAIITQAEGEASKIAADNADEIK
ncbi:MAG: hypothetical protein ACYC51_00255 [Thermoleophilia bacterium]